MSNAKNIAVIILALVAWMYYKNNYPRTKESPRVAGYFHPSFRKVAETFRNNIANGKERGASFSVYHNGELLVDMWGGWADHGVERHWQENTLSIFFSATKGMAYLAVAKLVDMGVLEYKKELYHYWPEFKTNGMKNITVEMLLSHQAGLIGLDELISLNDYQNNWDKVEKLLSTQKLKWPPGTAVGYHAMTSAMYADALLRKVDPKHRNMSQFFEDEIAKPLDIEFYIGLPKELYHRFSRIQLASMWEKQFAFSDLPLLLNPHLRVINCFKDFQEIEQINNPDLLAIGMPSAVGVGNTKSLAKVYDYLANGQGISGRQLLSPPVIESLKKSVTHGLPNLFMAPEPFSQGFMLRRNKQGHETFGFPGFGGIYAFADTTIGIGMAYTTNYLGFYILDDPREVSLRDAFYECFEKYKAQQNARK